MFRRNRVSGRCMGGGSFLLVLSSLLAAAGCDDSFSPIAEGEASLSVFGYLDAAADTQWIRVMPIRPVKLTAPGALDAVVSLEHLGAGRTVTLQDSAFRFTHYADPELGSEGAWVHNFWTTEPLEPGARYRFSVRRADREPAETEVELPGEYEVEVWLRQISYLSDYLRIAGAEHLPFVTVNAHYTDRCGAGADTVPFKDRSTQGDVTVIPIRASAPGGREGCGTPRLLGRDLWIVASGEEWPAGQGYSPSALASAAEVSNVDNAVGFLGGVLTRTVPYESCELQGGGGAVPEHCRLRYGAATARITGDVIETRCQDGPLDSVRVELRELDGEPAAARRIRATYTSPAGSYQVGALEPGIRYALKVRAKPEPDPFWGEVDIHNLHYDTLLFAPGEEVRYHVELRRFTECGGGQ